jgi:hypothetical protein
MTRIKNDTPTTYYFYKLVCNDTNVKEFYIGSTVNWRDRKSDHKNSVCNKNHNHYTSIKAKTIRTNGGWDNWSMIEIERGIYIKRTAEAHEYDLMAQMKSTMNKNKCFGSSLKCEHGITKQGCKECGGSQICKHNKSKTICKECEGISICVHGKCKQYCKECEGSGLCNHKKDKRYCSECKGCRICEHNYIDKNYCPYCSPYLCECGVWTTKGRMNCHFQSAKCKAFHMTTYGRVFI